MQIFDLFDVKRNGVIEFGEFVRSLGVFHPNAPVEEKISCKFTIYLQWGNDTHVSLVLVSSICQGFFSSFARELIE